MRIITISREFGSGGRELGKRLADALGVPCYDQQIIDRIAQNKNGSMRFSVGEAYATTASLPGE